MCGIVGYVGYNQATGIIIEGLKKLEYRGYDSSGVAVLSNGKIDVRKRKGVIKNLEELIKGDVPVGTCGIGHTRWATHGTPSDLNSHPHTDEDLTVAVVHNGIVENYVELRDDLIKNRGVQFKTETDTEVIANLVALNYAENGSDLEQAVRSAISIMRGAYAIGVIAKDTPDKLVAYRKDAPLIAGKGDGENFIASDIPALLQHTQDMYMIENNEMVVCTADGIKIFDSNGAEVDREITEITWSLEDAEKGGYEHFMLKEIYDQPAAVRETLSQRLDVNGKVKLDGITLTKEELDSYNKIYIVACGTAYHAGLVGKYAIEKMARIPVEIDVASEFRYREPIIDDKTLFIAISQSGETLDTLKSLRLAKSKGARVLSIVNVVGSSVARDSHDVLYTWAGPEIAVASTKAYTTQLICMYLIALYFADLKGEIDSEYYNHIIEELQAIPDKIEKVLECTSTIESLADKFYDRERVFFIGRGLDSDVSYEGSLKLKEISYINSFAIGAGELKHGTIALMEEDTLVIALATQDFLFEKMYSNIVEVNARGAHVVSLTKVGREEISQESSEAIYVPKCADEISPLLSIVPLQLFAYYVARKRGEDIDKPRNLAKSVTVE